MSNSEIDMLKQRLAELQQNPNVAQVALDVAEVQRQIADLELAEYQFQRSPNQKVWVVKSDRRGFFESMNNLFKRDSAPVDYTIDDTE